MYMYMEWRYMLFFFCVAFHANVHGGLNNRDDNLFTHDVTIKYGILFWKISSLSIPFPTNLCRLKIFIQHEKKNERKKNVHKKIPCHNTHETLKYKTYFWIQMVYRSFFRFFFKFILDFLSDCTKMFYNVLQIKFICTTK